MEIVLLGCISLIALFPIRGEELVFLERSDTESIEQTIELTATYEDVNLTKDIKLILNQREETDQEKTEHLELLLKSLPERILGDNDSLSRVYLSLSLPKSIDGVLLEWATDRPDLIREDGYLYAESLAVEPGRTARVILTVTGAISDINDVRKIPITLVFPETEKEIGHYLNERINDWSEWVEGDATEPILWLDNETDEGIRLSWKRKGKRYGGILAVCTLIGILFVRENERLREKKKKMKAIRELEETYPVFIDELLLYLNAGLVLESALFRVAERHINDCNVFYKGLGRIRNEAVGENIAAENGFRAFAKETGIPAILRFSAVFSDAVRKGIDVTEKLETESVLIRSGKIRKAEEKGRKAETKLVFPMVLLLAALLLITLAPVLLEMGGKGDI